MSDRKFALMVVAIAAVAVSARLAVIAPRIGREAEDPDHYLTLAKSIGEGRGFTFSTRPTAYRPPLYPLLLAPLVHSTEPLRVVRQVWGPLGIYPFTPAIACLHLMLGGITVLLTMLAARRWGLGPIAVAGAGLIVAIDPLLVIQSRSVMTETLASALLAWAIAAAARSGLRGAIETGLAFGLAALCRPSLLACAGLTVTLVIMTAPGGWRARLRHAAVIAATVAATVAPWAVRNRLALGEFVWTTTHGGYTLALANNPDYYRTVLDGPPGAVWDEAGQRTWAEGIAARTAGLSEPEADRALASEGWRMLWNSPRTFLRASLARIGRIWALAPSPAAYGRASRWASTAWSSPLFAVAIFGLSRRDTWRWPRAIVPASIIGLSLVHFIYWTDMRMRTPLSTSVALAAISGVLGWKKFREKNPESPPSRVVENGGIG